MNGRGERAGGPGAAAKLLVILQTEVGGRSSSDPNTMTSGPGGGNISLHLLVILTVIGLVRPNPDAKRLYDDLLSNYNRLIRCILISPLTTII